MAQAARLGDAQRMRTNARRIVCGVDRSEHARAAARLAGTLARRLGRPLSLVHVVDTDQPSASRDGVALLESILREEVAVPDAAIRLLTGSVPETLAAAADRGDFLVVGTRGEGAIRQTLLGGVSGALTRAPSRPVVVVPPRAVAGGDGLLSGRCIVCGVRDRRDVAPAHHGAAIARDLGLALTLAHVRRSASAGSLDADRMLRDVGRAVSLNVPGETEVCVVEGFTGLQLERCADARDAAMLAVGASCRGALDAALTGAASRHLMRRADRPVMICPSSALDR
jgi:nucleotide-binding universal stress UspA family protein